MKKSTKLLLVALSLFIGISSYAQGIKFEKGISYKETIETAKSMEKMVMLDFYTDWCVPCKQMEERIFTQKRVGDAMNDYFISLRVDAEKGEGIELAQRFAVRGYPTLIFIGSDDVEKYRLRGAPLNVNFFIEVANIVKGNSMDMKGAYAAYLTAAPEDKLMKAQQIISVGPAHYSLMTGKEHAELKNKVKEVTQYYFKTKPVEQMINETDFDIISTFLDGANNETSQIQFLYKNYDKFKQIVPEIDLATFVVKVNNESIQDYSRKGDLIWKKFVNYINRELASAYALLGEKNPREIMSCVANINVALYVDKNFDRYISLRDRYTNLQKEIGSDLKGNYFYAAQILYRQAKGNLSGKQINRAIQWLELNEKEEFNLPATYLLMGDFYALLSDKKPEAIYNYNRCVMESKKQGRQIESYYTEIVKDKIANLNK